MSRHIGRHRDTDEQIVISFMLIPDQTTHALISYPGQLQETLRRELMAAVGSIEAQKADNLSDVLSRKLYADSGKSILQVLHEAQKLVRTPIDEVVMTPDGNHRVPLRAVLEAIQAIPAPDFTERFNPHTHNTVAEGQQEQIGVARNLLIEAEMLEGDALRKREQAYRLAPSLNPAKPEVKSETPAILLETPEA